MVCLLVYIFVYSSVCSSVYISLFKTYLPVILFINLNVNPLVYVLISSFSSILSTILHTTEVHPLSTILHTTPQRYTHFWPQRSHTQKNTMATRKGLGGNGRKVPKITCLKVNLNLKVPTPKRMTITSKRIINHFFPLFGMTGYHSWQTNVCLLKKNTLFKNFLPITFCYFCFIFRFRHNSNFLFPINYGCRILKILALIRQSGTFPKYIYLQKKYFW